MLGTCCRVGKINRRTVALCVRTTVNILVLSDKQLDRKQQLPLLLVNQLAKLSWIRSGPNKPDPFSASTCFTNICQH